MRIQEILQTSVTDFLSNDFEKSVVQCSKVSPNRFQNLLGVPDVLCAYEWANPSQIQVLKNGERGYRYEREKDLIGAYENGYSIIINDLHEQLSNLRAIIHSISEELSVGAEANLYLTPPHENGLSSHVDSHDGLILQVSGTKRWCTWGPEVELPFWSFRTQQSEQPSTEYVLHAGHALYLPRGVPHELKTEDDHSLHVTISLKSILGFELINEAKRIAAKQDPILRHSVGNPPCHDLVNVAQEKICQDTLQAAFETLKKMQICDLPKLDGFGRSPGDVHLDTCLYVSRGYPLLYRDGELAIPGLGCKRGQANVLHFDVTTAEIIERVLEMNQVFSLSDVQSGEVDGVLEVCRDMYSLGMLEIASA